MQCGHSPHLFLQRRQFFFVFEFAHPEHEQHLPFTTAFIILSGEAFPSTVIEFVSRLTLHSVTPSTAFTAFSTRAEQAAQLIPVILK